MIMHGVTILFTGLTLIACNKAESISNDARQYQEKVPNLGVVFPPPSACINPETGEFIRLEVSGCTNQPCKTAVGRQDQITATFILHRSTNHANFRVNFYGLSVNTTLYEDMIMDTLIAEKQYTIYNFLKVSQVHRGDVGQVLVDVYDSLTGDHYISRCFDMWVSIN